MPVSAPRFIVSTALLDVCQRHLTDDLTQRRLRRPHDRGAVIRHLQRSFLGVPPMSGGAGFCGGLISLALLHRNHALPLF